MGHVLKHESDHELLTTADSHMRQDSAHVTQHAPEYEPDELSTVKGKHSGSGNAPWSASLVPQKGVIDDHYIAKG